MGASSFVPIAVRFATPVEAEAVRSAEENKACVAFQTQPWPHPRFMLVCVPLQRSDEEEKPKAVRLPHAGGECGPRSAD